MTLVSDNGLPSELGASRSDRERYLQAILDRAPFGTHFYRLDPDGVLRFTGANPFAGQILRLDHQSLIGKTILEAFPGLAATPIPEIYRRLAREGGTYRQDHIDYRDGAIEGAFEIYAFQVTPGTMAVFFQDIADRKRTEEALRQKSEELDQYFNSSLDLLCIADLDGHFRRLNPEWENVLGYTLEELEGSCFLDFVHPDDRAATVEATKTLSSLKPVHNFVNRYRRKDGSYAWIEWRSFPVKGLIYAVARDITAHVAAEEAVRASEERFVQFMRHMPGYAYIKGPDRRILFVSDRFGPDFGIPLPEWIGKTNEEIWPGPPGEKIKADDLKVWATGEPLTVTETVPVRGEPHAFYTVKFPIPLSSGQTLLGGISFDVTDHERMHEALRVSEERFKRISKLTSDFAYSCVRAPGQPFRLEWVTGALERITGYSLEELYAWGCWAPMVHPEDRPVFEREVLGVGPGQSTACELRVVRKDQSVCWLRAYTEGVAEAGGEVHRLYGGCQDITPMKDAERDRLNLERQILQAQKLESLGVLAGGIAHDFNNLLTAIMGYLNLALDELSPSAPARDELLEAERATRRAADLAKQMLAYSGKGRFLIQVLSLRELVEEMAHMLQVSISKKAILRFSFGPDVPAVEVDATQIRQVVMNLVINASDAIGDRSGVITVSTGSMLCDQAYFMDTWLHEPLPAGRYSFLEVSDSGCGIARDQIDRIFDPFYSTKFTGRGLGLAAVLGIIRGHRGAIKVYSEPGRGTTFKVLLPASTQSLDYTEETLSRPVAWKGSGTVLLVDDEEHVRSIGKRMLGRLGFAVTAVGDGRQAIEVFRQQSREFVAVLLDLTMPHLDGVETFRELRRIRSDVSVVLSSGYNEQEAIQRFIGKGLAGFLQKPYTIGALEDVLRRVLGQSG